MLFDELFWFFFYVAIESSFDSSSSWGASSTYIGTEGVCGVDAGIALHILDDVCVNGESLMHDE